MKNELAIYQSVIDDVKGIISSGMESAYNATSRAMVLTYWNVGRRIVEQEQNGNQKAEYGTAMMAALGANFINLLQQEGYERIHINSEEELVANLRKQLEKLNDYTFTDNEWKNFYV